MDADPQSPPADPSDLPPLTTQSNPNTLYASPSPADPSSSDPITRSVASGQLSTQDDSRDHPSTQDDGALPDHPSSPSHQRTNSTRGGSGPASASALSVLNLLRGRGQVVGEDDDDLDDDDEEDGLGGPRLGMPLGALRAPSGATGKDMKKELRELHPYAQILGPGDVESCVALEEATFPVEQAASKSTIRYRLGRCGELSLGVFSSQEVGSEVSGVVTGAAAQRVETSAGRRGVLLGMVLATKTGGSVVRDEDMMVPSESDGEEGPRKGHDEAGRTIAVHALAVVPEYQKLGIGTMLMKSYVQRVMEADIADRIAILVQQRLMPFYARLGFENWGKSEVRHGGGGWVNMVLEFEGMRKKGEEE